ncbi:ABC transporter substrate-binding protein [Salsipaludibacter albus]|uniref:ABC transporter substrate-binding protein n=1 Tax=Salsipaludibacter albus TaxID=2849650 RepID=UPI001EE478CB|nr:ABC transporter substrate-binding protein [Salsipaludibacter albus]MBY5162825.1 ABC transporter substrate-binding protein [Salsipaludibacter albus]
MRTSRLLVGLAGLGLALTACGGVNDAGTDDAATDAATEASAPASDAPASEDGGGGGTVTVGGFNFPESTILGEIYAQALEGAGLEVNRQLDAGTREILLPEMQAGNVDIIPEYVGSLIATGYGETPETDPEAALEQAREVVSADDLALLEPAEAQDKNVFVSTTAWAEENGVTGLADLADAGDVTLAGGPECEDRETCFAGLSSVYGLDNVSFTTIQEKSPRLAALESDQVQMILLFSTDPVFEDGTLTILEDPENLSPPENVVPLVRQETLDASPEIEETLNEVSSMLTTEGLTSLNAQASQGEQPADIAAGWLEENMGG